MIEMILFDFDGTIADTLPAALKIANRHLNQIGHNPISKEQLKELRNMTPFQILRQFTVPVWRLPGLIKKIQNDLLKEVDHIKLFPGIEKALYDLIFARYHLGILTSNKKETVDTFLRKHRITFFEFIQCEPNIFEKPRLIKHFLKKHQLKPSEVIYIGDEIRDIEACRENGVEIISVTWGFNDENSLKQNKPNYIAKTPQELVTILQKIV